MQEEDLGAIAKVLADLEKESVYDFNAWVYLFIYYIYNLLLN